MLEVAFEGIWSKFRALLSKSCCTLHTTTKKNLQLNLGIKLLIITSNLLTTLLYNSCCTIITINIPYSGKVWQGENLVN